MHLSMILILMNLFTKNVILNQDHELIQLMHKISNFYIYLEENINHKSLMTFGNMTFLLMYGFSLINHLQQFGQMKGQEALW